MLFRVKSITTEEIVRVPGTNSKQARLRPPEVVERREIELFHGESRILLVFEGDDGPACKVGDVFDVDFHQTPAGSKESASGVAG